MATSALYLDHVSDAYEMGSRQRLLVDGLETGEGETDVDAENGSLPLALPLVVSALLREKASERTLRGEATELFAEEKFARAWVSGGHSAPRAALQQPEAAGGSAAVALSGLDRKSLPLFLLPGPKCPPPKGRMGQQPPVPSVPCVLYDTTSILSV